MESQPVIRVLREGNTGKPDPLTIALIANPALERPAGSGTFIGDPIVSQQAAFDVTAAYTVDCLFGDLPGQAEKDAQEVFSALMIFNLADLFGSVPTVTPVMARQFCSDWEILCRIIASVNGQREAFFEILRQQSQTNEATIQRLWRLMYAAEDPAFQDEITLELVEDTLRDVAFANLSRLPASETDFTFMQDWGFEQTH